MNDPCCNFAMIMHGGHAVRHHADVSLVRDRAAQQMLSCSRCALDAQSNARRHSATLATDAD
jgi:hypothetical protein